MNQQPKMFTREMVTELITKFPDRPWRELCKGREIDSTWLAVQLRPYAIKPSTVWIGGQQAKGYFLEDFHDAFRRYIPRAELVALQAEMQKAQQSKPAEPPPSPKNDDSSLVA